MRGNWTELPASPPVCPLVMHPVYLVAPPARASEKLPHDASLSAGTHPSTVCAARQRVLDSQASWTTLKVCIKRPPRLPRQ